MRASPSRTSRGWLLAAVLAGAAVLWLTLRPDDLPGFPTGPNLRPLEHHGRALQALFDEHPNREVLVSYLLIDVLGNVLLFAPLGLAVAGLLGTRPPAVRLAGAAGVGLLLSVAIEGIQLLVPGRTTDVDDVIFNGVGAVSGAALLLVAERLPWTGGGGRSRGRRQERRARGR